MPWFEYRTCNYFFYTIQAGNRAEADALLLSVFGYSLNDQCSHCDAALIEEVNELDGEAAKYFDTVDLKTLDPEDARRIHRQAVAAA